MNSALPINTVSGIAESIGDLDPTLANQYRNGDGICRFRRRSIASEYVRLAGQSAEQEM
jgi:hypothetical protein